MMSRPARQAQPGRAACSRIAMATTVIGAPHDPVHPIELARTLSGWIPGARFVEVPRKMPDVAEHQFAVQRAVAAAITEE